MHMLCWLYWGNMRHSNGTCLNIESKQSLTSSRWENWAVIRFITWAIVLRQMSQESIEKELEVAQVGIIFSHLPWL